MGASSIRLNGIFGGAGRNGAKRAFQLWGIPLAAAILALPGCTPAPGQRYEDAQKAYAAHDYAAARGALMAALKAQPDNAAYLELLARTQIRLEDGEGALVSLKYLQALGKLPEDSAILQGDAALLRGQFEEAMRLVQREPAADAARIRGLALVGMDKEDEADAAFAAGQAAAGPKAPLLGTYALYQMDWDHLDRAEQLAQQALALDGQELSALHALGGIAAKRGDQKAALAIADRILRTYPDDLPALFGKASALGELGRPQDISPLLAKLERLAPNHPRVTFIKAMLASDQGNWAKVREILQLKEREIDNQPDLQFLYAKALLNLGQVEQARAHLSPLLLRDPQNDEVRLMLASSQIAGQDWGDALETLRPYAARPHATAQQLALLAKVARKARDPMEGVYAAMAQTAGNKAGTPTTP